MPQPPQARCLLLHTQAEITSWDVGQSTCLAGLPWWLSGKESASQAGDVGLIPGSGRSPGEGNDDPLQYSCLGSPMDRGAWEATVYRVKKESAQLSNSAPTTCLLKNLETETICSLKLRRCLIAIFICISLRLNLFTHVLTLGVSFSMNYLLTFLIKHS